MRQDNTVVLPAGARPSTSQMRSADLVVIGNKVVKDRHGIRRTLNDAELARLRYGATA